MKRLSIRKIRRPKKPKGFDGKIKDNLTVPWKFAKVFRETAKAYKEATRLEDAKGHVPVEPLQKIIRVWARKILGIIDSEIEVRGVPPETSRPILLVGNHVSYVDIPLLLASVPVVFVAKAEISKWLIIGKAARIGGTVFVKRNSGRSRADAAEAIADAIVNKKRSVGVFPSGTTCISETKPWRHGVFKIAERHKIPVQPFRIRYEPLRKVAFIDDDLFAPHLMQLVRLKKFKAIIEFDEVRMIENATKDCQEIHKWTQEGIMGHSDPQ